MKSKYKTLTEIIKLCLAMDSAYHKIYIEFESRCKIPSLAAEWKLRTEEEKQHITFWNEALALSKKRLLPMIFENPEEVKDKIKKIHDALKQIISEFNDYDNPSEEIALAFLLENYMLDPHFMMLFHAYSFINENIEADYENHILAFRDMAKRYKSNSPALQMELINNTLYNLYISNKELLNNSNRDTLTDFYNRRGFFNNIPPILSLAKRRKLNVGIIMIDFDNFKEINDSLGHPAGDKVLKNAASIIKSTLRGSSICGRYGGDEFIILCDIENTESLETICERIRKNIDEKSKTKSGIHFTVSLGAATGKIIGQDKAFIAKIIQKADENLFKAKEKGRNGWIV